MIKYSELMIGDYVLVNGTPRKVEMITKKKIGYHLKENEPRMYYARLRDVEPIEVTRQLLEKVFVSGASEDDFYTQVELCNISILICNSYNILVRIDNAVFTSPPYVDMCVVNQLHLLQNLLRTENIEIDWKL